MTEAQFPYETTSWPMESLIDLHVGQHDELGLHPFIASDFPLTMQEGLDPSRAIEQLSWVDEYPVKSTAFQPYPQTWYDAGLVREDCGGTKNNVKSFSRQSSQTIPNPRIHPRPDLQLATQRALFMTPSPKTLAFFPGSPNSDPHASPEPSHASSSGWEGEVDYEDFQYMQFDFGPGFATSALESPYQAHGQTHSLSSPRHQHSRIEEECLTPLEMPDGSTRMTSNWLPVDPDAGSAINFSVIMNEDVAAFQDMKHAFFPSVPAAWSYDR
ncbi:hypothetical protein DTO013E5_8517 [Penicillium roqueforti]|nr:hypothetical protein DTO012A1_4982 [Penicillium roqueforti]KAI2745799.1 hypothetical protein DTO013F2_7318 [Penicillium roqueforti]KAI3201753.1 hypothetical protein DTO013E5_8517 [Penicillium roqueforti]